MAEPALTPARLLQMQECFERALELDPMQRDEYLHSVEGEDAELAIRVRSLLAAHARTGSELESPISSDAVLLLDPSTDRWIGERVGVYEISRRIGAGGMGTVYEATRADDQYHQRVAIKLLNQHATGAATLQRFRRERQILANLHHPHIASLLDGGVTADGHPYFAMEYIEGEPITHWCDARSAPIARRLELFRQVCSAVQYAHQSLVIHRDLKPANILVTVDGAVKLLDFGIAKLMPSETGDELSDLPTTRIGSRAFTPDYAAPEQLLGLPVGTRADVYALGVVLYELLAGVRPYELRGKSAAQAERIVSDVTPTRPSQVLAADRSARLAERSMARARARIEGDLDAIILKALRKEPERRYGSADELSADVGNYLAGRPVAARPERMGYLLGKLVRRRRVEAVAVGLVIVSTVAGVITTSLEARSAERERARSAEITNFLTTMLGAANPASFGRNVQVREVLDSAVVRADQLDARPEFEAEIRGIIGGTYLALGEFELGETQHRRAVAALERVGPSAERSKAFALTQLSTALEFQGRYAAADSVLQSASAMFDRLGHEDEEARIDHLDQRGRILIRVGRMPEAVLLLEEALALQKRRTPVNDSSLAYSYANLGMVSSELGRNVEAESLFVAALAAARRAHGDVHPLVAAILSPLGTVQERAKLFPQADSTFRAALAMRRELLGEEHPDYAWTMFNYADFLLRLGRYPEAAEWCRRVIALRGRSLQDAHPAVATSMGVLGRALGQMDSLPVAERWLRESLAIRRAAFPAGHYLIASSESILGEHMVLAGRYGQAEELLLKAEKDLVVARGEEAPIIQDARGRLVKLYKAWGKKEEAERWRAKLSVSPGT
jgi:eukaryotic-like serine/threonine-protein kinase